MRCELRIIEDLRKSAPQHEQITFLTNENIPNIQEQAMYKGSAVINECLATKNYKKLVRVVARKLNFNMHIKGTDYFISTLLFLFENELSPRQCDAAFEMIAKEEGITEKQVRKRITNALNAMDNSVDKEKFYRLFPEYDGRHPSLMYSLTLALERLEEVSKRNE